MTTRHRAILAAACILAAAGFLWSRHVRTSADSGEAGALVLEPATEPVATPPGPDRPPVDLVAVDALSSSGIVMNPSNDAEARAVVEFARGAGFGDASALRAMARADHTLVASNGVRALGRLGLLTSTSDEAELLEDPRPRVRQEVVRGLGQSGDERAVPQLVALLEASDSVTRDLAIQALGKLGGEPARAALEDRLKRAAGQERVFLERALEDARRPRREPAGD